METKTDIRHTPGPWKINGRFIGPSSVDNHSDNAVCATPQRYEMRRLKALSKWDHPTDNQIESTPTPEDTANARLIAAAPELLEALEALLNCVQPDRDWNEAKAARAAIARAKGGNS